MPNLGSANQAEIVAAAREMGASVVTALGYAAGMPHFVVGWRGHTIAVRLGDNRELLSLWTDAWRARVYIIAKGEEMRQLLLAICHMCGQRADEVYAEPGRPRRWRCRHCGEEWNGE